MSSRCGTTVRPHVHPQRLYLYVWNARANVTSIGPTFCVNPSYPLQIRPLPFTFSVPTFTRLTCEFHDSTQLCRRRPTRLFRRTRIMWAFQRFLLDKKRKYLWNSRLFTSTEWWNSLPFLSTSMRRQLWESRGFRERRGQTIFRWLL